MAGVDDLSAHVLIVLLPAIEDNGLGTVLAPPTIPTLC
jgi:hypothetical protein